MRRPLRPVIAPALTAIALLLLVTGCSDSDDPDPATTTPPATSSSSALAEGCAELAELETSLVSLSNVEPVNDGLDAVESAVADSKADLEAAAGAVSDALQPSVEQVQTAFDELESSLQGVTSSNLAESATEIGNALASVGTAATDLQDTLNQECPDS